MVQTTKDTLVLETAIVRLDGMVHLLALTGSKRKKTFLSISETQVNPQNGSRGPFTKIAHPPKRPKTKKKKKPQMSNPLGLTCCHIEIKLYTISPTWWKYCESGSAVETPQNVVSNGSHMIIRTAYYKFNLFLKFIIKFYHMRSIYYCTIDHIEILISLW